MAKGQHIAYVRVSTVEQNEARQVEALKRHDIDRWFTEKTSGKNTNRSELQRMLEFVREGDTVYIHDLSRLARSTKDLLEIVDLLKSKGVDLVSNKENIDSSTPTGKLMLTMIGAIAEFERANLLERQREGIAIAKKAGKYKGRKKIEVDSELFKKYYDKYMKREINKVQFAKAIKISRPTLDKMLKEYVA
ncbi:recombinase family protein [Butyrivibrio sp. VCD2006]|uniref:recombinase family protein n=1 Tax=Butyrivibrio sp. VCD2006 TaxID=1280664 RepID=UPI0003FB59B4|nr:recombinase family protein [Butyrivibrio sp. VCD2006]